MMSFAETKKRSRALYRTPYNFCQWQLINYWDDLHLELIPGPSSATEMNCQSTFECENALLRFLAPTTTHGGITCDSQHTIVNLRNVIAYPYLVMHFALHSGHRPDRCSCESKGTDRRHDNCVRAWARPSCSVQHIETLHARALDAHAH